MAPEVLKREEHDKSIDFWSYVQTFGPFEIMLCLSLIEQIPCLDLDYPCCITTHLYMLVLTRRMIV